MALSYMATLLHAKIASICPVDGISIGDPADSKTWRIDFAVSATPAQMAVAQAALAAITPTALTTADNSIKAAAAAIVVIDPLATAKTQALASLPTAVVVALPA